MDGFPMQDVGHMTLDIAATRLDTFSTRTRERLVHRTACEVALL